MRQQVRYLMQGPDAAICDECISFGYEEVLPNLLEPEDPQDRPPRVVKFRALQERAGGGSATPSQD